MTYPDCWLQVGTVNEDGLVTGVLLFDDLYGHIMSHIDYEHGLRVRFKPKNSLC